MEVLELSERLLCLHLFYIFLLKMDAALQDFFFVNIKSETASLRSVSEMLVCTNISLNCL